MFAHVTIRASEQVASERFYRTVLEPLEIEPEMRRGGLVAWDDFAIAQADTTRPTTRHLHVAFVAPSHEHVEAFWRAGRDAGHRDDGAPGPRTRYREDYYGAFLLDPDGNSAEAVHHADCRRGGHIDHLWIGVRDLARSEAFYAMVSPHIGLRPGRRWDDGIQFRGAWATFSVVADGRHATQGLHMAFPAPDRVTVEDFHRTATAAGYPSNGEPGERPQYGPGYYAAYVLDPDGGNIESVVGRRPGRRTGNPERQAH
jgi:catechol 2,3-dioxygenase-like lactoylglutathione lyase family enzyme